MAAFIDAHGSRVLDELQADASLTNHALAQRVHTSPATCLRRVKRLVDAACIERRVRCSRRRLGTG